MFKNEVKDDDFVPVNFPFWALSFFVILFYFLFIFFSISHNIHTGIYSLFFGFLTLSLLLFLVNFCDFEKFSTFKKVSSIITLLSLSFFTSAFFIYNLYELVMVIF